MLDALFNETVTLRRLSGARDGHGKPAYVEVRDGVNGEGAPVFIECYIERRRRTSRLLDRTDREIDATLLYNVSTAPAQLRDGVYRLADDDPLRFKIVEVDIEPVRWALPGSMTSRGQSAQHYDFQQYVTFLADTHMDEGADAVAIMDTDAFFITPVMPRDLFTMDGRIIAKPAVPRFGFERDFKRTTEHALAALPGFRYIGNFMSYFPVLVWKSTFRMVRTELVGLSNVSTFEEAFLGLAGTPAVNDKRTMYSQFDVMMHIAAGCEPGQYLFPPPVNPRTGKSMQYPHLAAHNFDSFAPKVYIDELIRTLCRIYPAEAGCAGAVCWQSRSQARGRACFRAPPGH